MPTTPSPTPPASSSILRWSSDRACKTVDWLWKPYLPRGFVTVFAGPKWAGKTWCNLAIIAALTRGKGLPGVSLLFDPTYCIYVSSEDPDEYVLNPRLEALGADRSRVKVAYAAMGMNKLVPILRAALVDHPFAYICIDPLLSFIPDNKRSISSEDMRSVLDPLGQLANDYHCVVNVTTHLSKQPYADAIDRISGSAQIAAQGRSILFADKCPAPTSGTTDPTRRVLVHAGTNLAEPGMSWAYRIYEGKLIWEVDPCIIDSEQLFGLGQHLIGSQASAYELIVTMCSEDWQATADVEKCAESEGISRRTLYRVAQQYCDRRRIGVGTKEQKVYWHLKTTRKDASRPDKPTL